MNMPTPLRVTDPLPVHKHRHTYVTLTQLRMTKIQFKSSFSMKICIASRF